MRNFDDHGCPKTQELEQTDKKYGLAAATSPMRDYTSLCRVEGKDVWWKDNAEPEVLYFVLDFPLNTFT